MAAIKITHKIFFVYRYIFICFIALLEILPLNWNTVDSSAGDPCRRFLSATSEEQRTVFLIMMMMTMTTIKTGLKTVPFVNVRVVFVVVLVVLFIQI